MMDQLTHNISAQIIIITNIEEIHDIKIKSALGEEFLNYYFCI